LTILKEWLIQAIKGRNSQLVRQELKVIYTLPITVDTLSKSGMGRLVKKLEGHSNDVVKKWATRITNNWKVQFLFCSSWPFSSPLLLHRTWSLVHRRKSRAPPHHQKKRKTKFEALSEPGRAESPLECTG